MVKVSKMGRERENAATAPCRDPRLLQQGVSLRSSGGIAFRSITRRYYVHGR